MDQLVAQSIITLCQKMCKTLDDYSSRIKDLESKVRVLEARRQALLSITQVAKATGWSIATVAYWLEKGFIQGIPVEGHKNLAIPEAEIDKILLWKGYGKNLKK